jgi:hypothetical protein
MTESNPPSATPKPVYIDIQPDGQVRVTIGDEVVDAATYLASLGMTLEDLLDADEEPPTAP